MLVSLVVGVVASLGRIRGRGAFDTMFGEDGSVFLNDAWGTGTPQALVRPLNGYFHLVPRMLAEIAALFPATWAPGVLSVQAAIVFCVLALVVYVACGAHLQHPLARLLVSVPVVLVPTAHGLVHGESGPVDNNIATLQFPATYAVFWALLWVPAHRWGQFVAVLVALLATLSSMLPIVFLPLAAARLFARRDRASAALVAAFGGGIAVQVLGALAGLSTRDGISQPRTDPEWIITQYADKVVPHALLGEVWLAPPHPYRWEHLALQGLAWLILLGTVILAATRMTSPTIPLAVVAGGFSVVLFAFEIVAHGSVPARYITVPAWLVMVALVALLAPSSRTVGDAPSGGGESGGGGSGGGGRWDRFSARGARLWLAAGRRLRGRLGELGPQPLVALAVLVAVVLVANLRVDSYRSHARSWRTVLQEAAVRCDAGTTYGRSVSMGGVAETAPPSWVGPSGGRYARVDFSGTGWHVYVPCDRVR